MRVIRWTRRFGFRRMIGLEIEMLSERLASWLLAGACALDSEIHWDQINAEEARKTAYDLVYGRIDASEAKRRFFAIYY